MNNDLAEAKVANWLDRTIAYFAPTAGAKRVQSRKVFAFLAGNGYEAARPSRKRKFSLNGRSGDSLTGQSAEAIRNQARHLTRNLDIAKGAIDRLVDGMVGPNGINIEPQPKRKDGSIHTEFAAVLHRRFAKWGEHPEVTGMYDFIQAQRLVAATWLRDGECLAQEVAGPRFDGPYADPTLPYALELLEPDFCPHGYEDLGKNIRQGIQRNAWGRATAYFVYKVHPGDYGTFSAYGVAAAYADLKLIPASQMLHVRLVDRLHTMRGISIMASVINTLQDIHEYKDFERMAAKMAASMVMNITYGAPEMWGQGGNTGATPNTQDNLPVWQMTGGMVVANPQPGSKVEFFDTKRPNVNAVPFIQHDLRCASAGFGLSYSSLSRDYNGTYSAQRQELVENRPGMEAGTMIMVAQFVKPTYESVVDWIALSEKLPADLDISSIHDALYLGPPMVWIDPAREADARLAMVSAGFTSRSKIVRQLGDNPVDVDNARKADNDRDAKLGLVSLSNAAASVSPAKPPDAVIEGGAKGSSVTDIRAWLRSRNAIEQEESA